MDSRVYQFLIHKTNEKIVTENIHPYAYQCISKELSRDIRSFHSDTQVIDYMYNYYYRPNVLYTDLMYYLNNTDMHEVETISMPAFFHIIRRFYPNKELTDKDVMRVYYKLCYYESDENILCNRIRFIIGMLSPEERTDFINRYLFT